MKSKIYKICPDCGASVKKERKGARTVVTCEKCDWSETVKSKRKVRYIEGFGEKW